MKLDVLLTDGDYKNTYAILRALKSQGLKVGILFHKFFSVSLFSHLVDKRFFIKSKLVKNPSQAIFANYFKEVEKILMNNNISVFMPVGNISYKFSSLYKYQIERYCKVPVVEKEIMEIAQDKTKTFEHAEKNNIPIPHTIKIEDESDFFRKIDSIKFPCVLKKTNYNESGVVYCNTKNELLNTFNEIISNKKKDSSFPVIQEYISGSGTGYYGIYNNGKCVGYFMHERIHEFPITGGASTLAKSIYEEDLKIIGDKLLSSLHWNGVAMVEFKRDLQDKKLKLMEINPKFWGSLELSYQAGINFPYLAYLVAMDKPIPDSFYKNDVYFRWTFPHDVVWYKYASPEQRKKFKDLRKKVKIYTNTHWDDPLVVFFNLFFTVFKLVKEQKYPHGFIK